LVTDRARSRRGAGDAARRAGGDDRPRRGPARDREAARVDWSDAHGQAAYEVRFDWGPAGLAAVGAGAAVVVVVDVLRFTTAVSVAIGRGAVVLPYAWAAGDAAAAYARRHGAQLAGRREDGDWSLSPTDLLALPAGTQLVLPSPNGSALAFGAADGDPDATVLAGCLRNATAVARAAAGHDGPVAVVAAGERWHGDLGPVRPAVEDLVGAGAVLRGVADGRRASGAAHGSAVAVSPEAEAAIAAFAAVGDDLGAWLAATASGRELAIRGWADDVVTAAALDAESAVPVLDGPRFVAMGEGRSMAQQGP
jgi:2-phosphosulfolactate phosphatase